MLLEQENCLKSLLLCFNPEHIQWTYVNFPHKFLHFMFLSGAGGGVCGNTKKAELLILTMVKIIKKDFEMLKLLMMPCL